MALLNILSIDPENNSTIYINQQFKIVFDKQLDQSNLADSIMLANEHSVLVPLTVTYSTKTIDGNIVGVVKVVPNVLLDMNTKHTLILRGDFNLTDNYYDGIKSIDNDVLSGNVLFNYTTNTLTYTPPSEEDNPEIIPPDVEQTTFITDIHFKPTKYPKTIFTKVEPYIYVIVPDEITKITTESFHVYSNNLLSGGNSEEDITIEYQDNYVFITLNNFVNSDNTFRNRKITIYLDEGAIETNMGVTPAISYYYYSPIDVFFITPESVRSHLANGDSLSDDEVYSIVYKESIAIYTNPAFFSTSYPTVFFYLSEKYILLKLNKERMAGTIMSSNGIKSQTLLGASITFHSPSENNAQMALLNNELYTIETEMKALLNRYGCSAVKSLCDIGYPIEWRSDV